MGIAHVPAGADLPENHTVVALLALCIVLLSVSSFATQVRVTQSDGTTFTGELLGRSTKELIIRTSAGTKSIPVSDVRTVDFVIGPTGDALSPWVGDATMEPLSQESARLLLEALGYADPTPMAEAASATVVSVTPSVRVSEQPYMLSWEGEEQPAPALVSDGTPPEKDIIHLSSGRKLEGILVEDSEMQVVIMLDYGRISVPRSLIKVIEHRRKETP